MMSISQDKAVMLIISSIYSLGIDKMSMLLSSLHVQNMQPVCIIQIRVKNLKDVWNDHPVID